MDMERETGRVRRTVQDAICMNMYGYGYAEIKRNNV
jgi:hypothetical protein